MNTRLVPSCSRPYLAMLLAWLSMATLATRTLTAGTPAAGEEDTFPAAAQVLRERCIACHHTKQPSGGLDLTGREALIAGGDSGTVWDAQAPTESYLLQRVLDGEMPPEEKGVSQMLPPQEVASLRHWLEQGAPWPPDRHLDPFDQTTRQRAGRDWWSLQPIQRPELPISPSQSDWARNPIDRWIEHSLNEAGLQPADEAPRDVLVRRLYFDLIGLPPTQEQVLAFTNDPAPEAYEKVVDQLLASPQFGERWARYWLDLVRFAETSGYERDQLKPYAWRYRDWVVQAFNDDLPYDQFVVQQLAGDEISTADEASVIATGFLRLGTWNDEPNDPHEYKYERLEDLVHATSSAFLGLTVKCARCHDHKFDPIPQDDYYRMAAAFWAGPIQPRGSDLLGGPSNEELGYDRVLGWTDLSSEPAPLHLLRNGDPKQPLEVVAPGYLSLLPTLDRPLSPPAAESKTTQRRLQLARWIVDPSNPLTPRVIVNRLWQHHFGQALVRSPNNFGFTGEESTHPQLLDWLAAELLDPTQAAAANDARHALDATPWRLKRLHKLMVMSATYRQSSDHPQDAAFREVDAANRLWWRAERRRLDAESLRDAMLVAAGQLDLTVGGESFKGSIDAEALEGLSRKGSAWQTSPLEEQNRRSLYMFSQRSLLDPFLSTFDFVETTLPCGERDTSTVAPQALALLNGSLTHQQSKLIAQRVNEQSDDPVEQVQWAWRFVLGREPQPAEITLALQHLVEQRQQVEQRAQAPVPQPANPEWPAGLQLALFSDEGLELDESRRVTRWRDQSGQGHDATQSEASQRPQAPADQRNEGIVFDGQARFLHLNGQIVEQQHCTILAVATDQGPPGHRELFSNWDGGAGNSGSSLFLGLTAQHTFRFSDAFVGGSWPGDRSQPALLMAVNDSSDAQVWVNGTLVSQRGSPLPERRLDTHYVVGQQGNIGGEYWHGSVLALLVWERPLSAEERQRAMDRLAQRFQLQLTPPPPKPERLALQSLCHVLLNSNEFLYVD